MKKRKVSPPPSHSSPPLPTPLFSSLFSFTQFSPHQLPFSAFAKTTFLIPKVNRGAKGSLTPHVL